ncbi:MAG: hypothetical protein U1E17_09530 [Geminicoccaceae bacterium]
MDLTAARTGGEAGLLADMEARLAGLGLTARPAIADHGLAAWAWARFGTGAASCRRAGRKRRWRISPVAALRIAPDTAAALRRLGLRRIGQLAGLPRAASRLRFGQDLVRRLDQLAGAAGAAAGAGAGAGHGSRPGLPSPSRSAMARRSRPRHSGC